MRSRPVAFIARLFSLSVPRTRGFGKFVSEHEETKASANFGDKPERNSQVLRESTTDLNESGLGRVGANEKLTREELETLNRLTDKSGQTAQLRQHLQFAAEFVKEEQQSGHAAAEPVARPSDTSILDMEVQRIERWKTVLAVSAGAAGVVGFLVSVAVLLFAS